MSRQEIFALLRRRWGVGLVIGAYVMGGAYVLAGTLFAPRVAASSPPPAVRHMGARLKIDGADVTRAGGATLSLDAKLLQLRQTCVEACDRIVVSYRTAGESLYEIQVLDQRGGCVLCQSVYSEGYNDDRVALGADGRLKLEVGLFGY